MSEHTAPVNGADRDPEEPVTIALDLDLSLPPPVDAATIAALPLDHAESVRRIYRCLGHAALGCTELACRSVSGEVSIGYYTDEDAFVAAAAAAHDVIMVGLQPRPLRLLDRAPNELRVGVAGAAPDDIEHVTMLGIQIEPAAGVESVLAAKIRTSEPLCAVDGGRGIVLVPITPVAVTTDGRRTIDRRLRAIGADLDSVDGVSVRLITHLSAGIEVTRVRCTRCPERTESEAVARYLSEPGGASTDPTLIHVPIDALREGTHHRGSLAAVDVSDLLASLPGGQIHPIIVRPLDGGAYEIIDGHRRALAARMLRWPSLRAEVHHCTDAAAMRLAVEAGLARRDLEPAQQARALARWKMIYESEHPETRPGASGRGRERGGTPRYSTVAAQLLGMAERRVQRLTMLGVRAIDAVLDAWGRGAITQVEAERIGALLQSVQQEALDDLLAAKGAELPPAQMFARAARAWLRAEQRVIEAARDLEEVDAERIVRATRPLRDLLADLLGTAGATTPSETGDDES